MIYFKVLSLCIAFLGMITTTTSTPFLVLNNGNITTQASVNKTFSSVIKKKPSGGFKVGPNIRTVVTGGLEKVLSEMLSSDAKADSQWTVYPLPRGDEYSGTVYPVPRGDEIPGTVYPTPRGDEYPEETHKTLSPVIKKKTSGGFEVRPNIATKVTVGIENILSGVLSSGVESAIEWSDEFGEYPAETPVETDVYPETTPVETDFDADSGNIDTIPDDPSRTTYPADFDSDSRNIGTIRDGIVDGQIIG
jgi:hypothetical protein